MEIICNPTGRIRKNQKKLENALKIKIVLKGRKAIIESEESLNEYIAGNVLEAIDAGYSINTALLLVNEEYLLEKVPIKNLTKRKNLGQIRARIIGKDGSTLELLNQLSDCYIKLHDNIVYVIGKAENIKRGINAATKLIQGSKQASVYGYLEKQRKIQHDDDLTLKMEYGEEDEKDTS